MLAHDLWDAAPNPVERERLTGRLFGAHNHAVKFRNKKTAFLDGLPPGTRTWIREEIEKVNGSYSGEDPIVDLNTSIEDIQTLAQIVQALDEGSVMEGMYPHPDAVEWGLHHRK